MSLRAFAEESELAPLAAKSPLLDVAHAGNRFIAVGDRGHVLLSDDEGRTWKQVIVPTRAMLTGASFGDAQHGWAVGHDGVILTTTDHGATWTRQDSGHDLETIWLDVFFSDAAHGLVVGAYGKCVLTMDGGKTWQPAKPSADEVHLNHIAPTMTDRLYLAGETGTLLTATDARTPWQKLNVPYEGSLFGALALAEQSIIAYGMRGHIFVSGDAGQTWSERPVSVPALILNGIKLKSGTIVLAGTGGNFFVSRDSGASFTPWKTPELSTSVSAITETNDGALLTVGEAGAVRLPLPSP